MAIAEWRLKLIDSIIGRAKADGHSVYSWEVARNTLDELAEIDKTREKKNRVSANYFLNEFKATDRAIQVLLGQVRDRWAEVGPTKLQPMPLIEKIEQTQPLPDQAKNDPDEVLADKLGDINLFYECVIAIRVVAGNAFQKEDIENYLNTIQSLVGVKFRLVKLLPVVDRWVDIHIAYKKHLAKIYDALHNNPLVEDAITKPLADFGRKTIAYKRTYVN